MSRFGLVFWLCLVGSAADAGGGAGQPGLAKDVAGWSAELESWTTTLEAASRALGRRPVDPAAVRDTLRLVQLQAERLRARAEAVIGLDPAIDFDLRQLLARTEAVRTRHAATLLVARVYALDAATRAAGPEAAAHADDLASELIEFADGRVEFDPVWEALLRWAEVQGDDARLAAWAAGCEARCAVPATRELAAAAAGAARDRIAKATLDPLRSGTSEPAPAVAPAREPRAPPDPDPRWTPRVQLSWTTPIGEGRFEGQEVRLGPAGGLELAMARSAVRCGALALSYDRWRVPDHPGDLRWTRARLTAGWCPELLTSRTAEVAFALRPVIGVGAALGAAREREDRQTAWGIGVAARLDLVIRSGRAAWIPWVALAPYGRVGVSPSSRIRFTWNERPLFGLAVSWDLRAATRAQTLHNVPVRSRP